MTLHNRGDRIATIGSKEMRKGKLGQMLIDAELISKDQLKKAVDMQKILGGKLASIIVKLGFVTDEALTKFLAKKENLPITDLTQLVVPQALVEQLPQEVLEKHQVVPVASKGDVLTLAMSDPTDFEAVEEVQWLSNSRVEITMASRAQVAKCLNDLFYGGKGAAAPEPADEAPTEAEDPGKAETIEPGLEKALIPLLVDKGIITLDELRAKAQDLAGDREA